MQPFPPCHLACRAYWEISVKLYIRNIFFSFRIFFPLFCEMRRTQYKDSKIVLGVETKTIFLALSYINFSDVKPHAGMRYRILQPRLFLGKMAITSTGSSRAGFGVIVGFQAAFPSTFLKSLYIKDCRGSQKRAAYTQHIPQQRRLKIKLEKQVKCLSRPLFGFKGCCSLVQQPFGLQKNLTCSTKSLCILDNSA